MQRYALRKIGETRFTKTVAAASHADAALYARANGFDHTRIDCLGPAVTATATVDVSEAQDRLAAAMQRFGGLSEIGARAAAAGRGPTITRSTPVVTVERQQPTTVRELAAQHRSAGAVELREQDEKKLANGLARLGLSEAGATAGARGR